MHRRGESGFTLIEALTAVALLAIAAATASSLIGSAYARASSNAKVTRAVVLAERELETLRALEYEEIDGRSAIDTWQGVEFSLSTSVEVDEPAPNMKEITVTISWNDRGVPRAFVVGTTYTRVQG